jgi:TRAP-type C4-dicarboxylate transport system permease large subunit
LEGPKACLESRFRSSSAGRPATVVFIGSILLPAMVAQDPDDQRADPAGDDRLDQGQWHRLGRVPAVVNLLLLAGDVMEPSSIVLITAPICFRSP